MHEQTAVKSHSGLLLSSKKLITATNSNREESQRHDAKWKEPDTKDDTMNDLLIQNSRKDKTKKKRSVVVRTMTSREHEQIWGGGPHWRYPLSTALDDGWLHNCIHLSKVIKLYVYLKLVNFIICK